MRNDSIQPCLRLRKDFPGEALFKLGFGGQNIWKGLLKIREVSAQRRDLGRMMHSGSRKDAKVAEVWHWGSQGEQDAGGAQEASEARLDGAAQPP